MLAVLVGQSPITTYRAFWKLLPSQDIARHVSCPCEDNERVMPRASCLSRGKGRYELLE